MENTINGAKENTAVKPVTAVNSADSPKPEKPNTKKTKEPITPAEAAELLTSALSYCLESGLKVIGYNDGTALRLSIEGLEYRNDKIQLVTLIDVTPVTVEKEERNEKK